MTHLDHSLQQELHRQLPMLDQLVAEELQRTHTNGNHSAVKMAWCCPSCRLYFDQVTVRELPEPAGLPHEQDCAWLQRWQSLSERCRLGYQSLWQTRPTATRHTIRSGFTPRHPVVIYRIAAHT